MNENENQLIKFEELIKLKQNDCSTNLLKLYLLNQHFQNQIDSILIKITQQKLITKK